MIPFETYACHDDTRMVEWIDGDLALLPPLSPAQGHIRDQLLALLSFVYGSLGAPIGALKTGSPAYDGSSLANWK